MHARPDSVIFSLPKHLPMKSDRAFHLMEIPRSFSRIVYQIIPFILKTMLILILFEIFIKKEVEVIHKQVHDLLSVFY